MKALRIIYYILFTVSALISVNFIYNILRGGGINIINMGPLAVALIIVAVQIVGFVMVILDRNRIATGILSIFTGIATYFSGAFASAALGAPAPHILGDISYASYIAGWILLVCYTVVGVMFIYQKFRKQANAGC